MFLKKVWCAAWRADGVKQAFTTEEKQVMEAQQRRIDDSGLLDRSPVLLEPTPQCPSAARVRWHQIAYRGLASAVPVSFCYLIESFALAAPPCPFEITAAGSAGNNQPLD